MFFHSKITFPRAQWIALREALKRAPLEFVKKVDTEIAQFKPDLLEEVTYNPGATVYPIEWTPSRHPEDRGKKPNVFGFGRPYYSRQKAAYFATRGFGKGIPSKRSGRLQQSWQVTRQGNQWQSQIIFRNTDPKFPYVIGKWQQRFHANTGWRRADLALGRGRQRVRRRITRLLVLTIAEAANKSTRG